MEIWPSDAMRSNGERPPRKDIILVVTEYGSLDQA